MGGEVRLNIFDMTKEDFEKVPKRYGWSRDIGEFNSLIIIPQNHAHESGWMCMDFVAVNKDGEPICRLSGCSYVLNLDGIGGYGNLRGGEVPRFVEPKGWCIDCLPCGYLRLFSRSPLTAGPALSDFEIYAKEIDRAPTIDAVPVVRCKDCKWLYDEMDDYCCRSHSGLARICENSFCSYGERKDDDGNG